MTFDELYPDPLLDLQDEIVAALEAMPFFAAIEIISERPKTIAGKVEKTVAKLTGLFITVLTMEGKATDNYLAGPESDIFVDVSAAEKPLLNRVGAGYLTANRVCTQIIRALHYTKPEVAASKLIYQSFQADQASKELLIMSARFKTRIRFPAAK